MRFLRFGAVLVLSFASAAPLGAEVTGRMTPALSPRNASYSISARLDPATRTITASEIITWRNVTTRPVDDLRFHLYWNAWRDDRSSWQRERTLARVAAARVSRPGDFARLDVSAVRLIGGGPPIDLTGTTAFHRTR